MSLKIGIVGLPNVGKSTLFNALTRSRGANAQNFPFCTIDPNIGIVEVPDERLQRIAAIVKPEKVIPTAIQFVDIAGLVKNAHKGEGLGNKFLHHIREVDAICHVIRGFEDNDIHHVEGSVDPERDRETITMELELADLEVEERRKKEKRDVENLPSRLSEKPMIEVMNVSEEQLRDDEGTFLICAKLEEDLQDLSPEEAQELLSGLGVSSSGLDRLVQAAYKILNLLTFFTAGPKEVRAWTVRKGALAPEAAGVIHTDFEKGFICADVISYKDFIQNKGEAQAKAKGKLRQEGKSYVIQDGDVVHFKFNV